MKTIEDPQEPVSQKLIVSGSIGGQSEKLAASVVFAVEFAHQAGAPLAFNAAQSQRSQLLALLTPTTMESLTAGETVIIGSVVVNPSRTLY